jgi:hypothetical protein
MFTTSNIVRGVVIGLMTAGCRPAALSPAPRPQAAAKLPAKAVPATPSPASPSAPGPFVTGRELRHLPGDQAIPEPWRFRFRFWLTDQSRPSYVRVLESEAISNAVTVVLERRSERDGVCLAGPTRLALIQETGATQASAELQDFGDDCCPGTECVPSAEGWNLRYLALVAAKDWAKLALLVPAKRALRWTINAGEQPTVSVTRSDVAKGKLHDPPGCGLLYNVPSCEGTSQTSSFTCRCDGGGSHVVFSWQKEGDGFVLVAIDESSS